MAMTLYVGNKNYSSWSLRPWLCLRWAGLSFQTQEIRLDQPGYGERQIADVLAVSPAGTVPALHVDDLVIGDSLAIAEWTAEQPGVKLWPSDPRQRALARTVTCEMHSGFAAVRRDLPMNIHRRCQVATWPADTAAGLQRIDALWSALRAEAAHRGAFLFGERCIADAFFTPVATRLRTYGVPLSAPAAAYRDALLADPDFLDWEAQCQPNSWDASGFSVVDGLYA